MPDRNAIWRITAASVAGTAHLKSGRTCEDAHCIQDLPNGAVIIAVGDGAGSADRGGEGARIAVESAVDFWSNEEKVPDVADQEGVTVFLSASLKAARSALENAADSRALLLRDFPTTLIVLVATAEFVAAAQIGDGASIVRHADGSLQP